MPTKLTLLGPAELNKHQQACVRVQCSCGSPEFVVRADSFKQGRTTSCGFCRKGGRRVNKPTPATPVVEQKVTPEVASSFTRGTPQWYSAEIGRMEGTALASENRARFLELKLAEQTATDLDTHKRWGTETTTARKLRQEIARLMTARDKAETGMKKDSRTAAEITRDRIKALKGEK
jgi:hypothetical protein